MRWLDPSLPATIPEKLRELLDAGVEAPEGLTVIGDQKNRSEADRLRAQMRAEALQPLADSDDTYGYSEARREAMSGGLSGAAAAAAGGSEGDSVEGTAATAGRKATFDAETVQDAIDWLQLPVSLIDSFGGSEAISDLNMAMTTMTTVLTICMALDYRPFAADVGASPGAVLLLPVVWGSVHRWS